MIKICKNFVGVAALNNVSFRLFPGEVHTLMGQNGAGKSTLVKVLTGVYKEESGTITLEGKTIRPESPLAAQKLGINTVFQEVNLCHNLTVAENIFIGKEPMRFGGIDWKKMNSDAEKVLARLNVSIDVTQILSSCSIAVQQMIAISRVLDVSAKILILDEPTSSLDESEVAQLFRVIRKLKEEGLAILFITHFLDQVYQISDRITVLKDGLYVGEYLTHDLPKLDLISKMLGTELSEFSYSSKKASQSENVLLSENLRGAEANENTLLKAEALGLEGSIAPFDLELNKGEVIGLAGLLGSGRTEMARLLFGISEPDQGNIHIKGKRTAMPNPHAAMMAGIGFCSEDRKNEGIFPDLSVRENIILALQAKQGIFKTLSKKRREEIASKLIDSLKVKTPNAGVPIGKLSGGNQQKVMLARWIATSPSIFILDEPTRGIDVGAKVEIMEQILNLSHDGLGIIFISSEFEEVIRCSSKIAILKDKVKIAELFGDDMTETDILHTIAGGGR